MKSTYEKRWGHSRTKKKTIHLLRKEQKRLEAEERNRIYREKQNQQS